METPGKSVRPAALTTPANQNRACRGPRLFSLVVLALMLLSGVERCWAQRTIQISTAPGGLTVTAGPAMNFGNTNGLGAGTPSTGLSLITTGVANGVLYTTPYNITVSGFTNGHLMSVTAYVSTNFTHPAILAAESCQTGAVCSSAANFVTLSTNVGSPTTITSSSIPNSTVTATLGIFVSAADGAGTFTGTDSGQIQFIATDLTNGRTATRNLSISITVQQAVKLLLSSAPGGLTISPAADYSANYGSVNGLGISPAPGLTVVSGAGGVIYTTPYVITPSFSSFSSTAGSVKAYVSANFAHPAILALEGATASGGPYTAISTSSGSPTVFTTAAASGTAITQYLGLFTSSANGASAFTGADSATLTYTLTVP